MAQYDDEFTGKIKEPPGLLTDRGLERAFTGYA
jgi:hypothetical protein